MNRKQKIDAIYEKIADKTLSFGCRIFLYGNIHILVNYNGGIYPYSDYSFLSLDNERIINNSYVEKIIGHPVMIGDVMDYLDENFWNEIEKIGGMFTGLWKFWQEKRKPIEEQSDECVDFVFDLIS